MIEPGRSAGVHWSDRPEGGGRFALWLLRTIALRGGRRLARLILHPVTWYFYLRRAHEREASRAFLSRVWGRPARPREVLRHLHAYAATTLDRVFLLTDRHRPFEVRVEGLDALRARLDPRRGILLLGAHLGSFEVLRALPHGRGDLDVRVVLDTRKTPAMTELLHGLDPDLARRVIDASRPGPELVFAMDRALRQGALVAVLGDRARPHEQTVAVDFLGAPARFPTAPFLVAALVKVPVILCLGLYRGGARYDLSFEPFADALTLTRERREDELREVVQRYARRLEAVVREDPYNWFNFYDFWADADPDAGDHPRS
ncbi:MAG TPA: acyltransferase [Dokdonella sp.]|uniref:LpxL/LpxP family acyltransferase n=1 Tax=Dokdonella sp. TaxID=2291710 RepID=UPI002BD18DE8|nr:acyltransferase [Dokdonella sp.]HUD41420.1 acyltransferase [Dokdonella sp.]